MNKIILDGKIIKPKELPDGSVVEGIYNNKIYHGEIRHKILCSGINENFPSEIFMEIKKLKDIQIYHIPGYQKVYMATDEDKATCLYIQIPKRKNTHIHFLDQWEDKYLIKYIGKNILNQTWKDEPWECWEKI